MEVDDESEKRYLTIPVEIICAESALLIHKNLATSEEDTTMYSRFASDFDLKTEEVIGQGAFGVVTSCKNKLDEKTYAIKKVPIQSDDLFSEVDDDTRLEEHMREAIILSKFDSRSIVRHHSVWVEAKLVGKTRPDFPSSCPCLYIQQELCDRSVERAMRAGPLTLQQCANMFLSASEGLKQIHAQNIRHGDINKRNIFLRNGLCKIGDFGNAQEINGVEHAKDDVHDLCVLLVEMLLNSKGEQENSFEVNFDLEMQKLPKDWPEDLITKWLMNMLNEKPSERPSSALIWKKRKELESAIQTFQL